jgi:ATP-dependent helicase Lhr and Lhr-like helicase
MEKPVPTGSSSATFELLHPAIQKWVWKQKWPALRPLQERAGAVILREEKDVILAAATASGKTEAAFLPILSRLAGREQAGVGVLYLSPLKALINDQYRRLREICEMACIPVHKWHGDVATSSKKEVVQGKGGLLLITPESLEALFVNRSTELRELFGNLLFIVIDEFHAFIGSERGKQLQSLLYRVDLMLRRESPRVALSATLGDMRMAAEFLRPGRGGDVKIIEDKESGDSELRMQLRGYEIQNPERLIMAPELLAEEEDETIADHLYRHLRGKSNLIFANSRVVVEHLADHLRRQSEAERVPNEFFPHHGNLSKELRESLEDRLKSDKPTSAVCTSTLEMGIDIGSVHSVAQIGCAPSVASLRQRWGRSGRKENTPSILRIYHTEQEIDVRSELPTLLRIGLVQNIAMIELALKKWYEPPVTSALHLSTLVHQIMSLVVQHGGVRPDDAFNALCKYGAFQAVTRGMFARVLRAMAVKEVLMQSDDGTLLLSRKGEKLTGHYSFYAVFQTEEEYRVRSEGEALGTIPIRVVLSKGDTIVFAGRRWLVLNIADQEKVIDVVPDSTGKARFTGSSWGLLHTEVLREMFRLFTCSYIPRYLNVKAIELLEQSRRTFEAHKLQDQWLIPADGLTYILAWVGTTALNVLRLSAARAGFALRGSGAGYFCVDASVSETMDLLRSFVDEPPPNSVELAAFAENRISQKYHWVLSDDLISEDFASSALSAADAWERLEDMMQRSPLMALGVYTEK